ncbi:MAG: hypothetical protein E7053_10330 [Lentisphaerae bacterium]|nr:hypothetical protein [Lentisphaerota bacterium]
MAGKIYFPKPLLAFYGRQTCRSDTAASSVVVGRNFKTSKLQIKKSPTGVDEERSDEVREQSERNPRKSEQSRIFCKAKMHQSKK